jgi:3-acetyloctanal synthase
VPQAAQALEDRPPGAATAPPLIFVDAAGAGLDTAPLDAPTAVVPCVTEAFAAVPPRNIAAYADDDPPALRMAQPYEVLRLPDEPWVLTADVVRRFTDHVQHHSSTALRSASRTGPPALAAALHGFLTERAGDRWGLHYFTGSVVSGLITELDRLADTAGNPVLRGPSEHSLACGALARWQLDRAPFLIVVTSGMVDEFRGTLANLRQAGARGFLVCADSPQGAWFPLQGTLHAAEDSRAVLAARRHPYVYLEDPATLQEDLSAAFAAYEKHPGPVVLLATAPVLASATPVAPETPRHPRPVLQVRDDQLAPLVDLVNSGPARLLWQCGPLDGEERDLVHEIAAGAGVALADSPIHPGSVSGYHDGRKVAEYLGMLALYGYSARVHAFLHRGGRLRPRDEQALLFLNSRIGEVSTPFSPRALARGLRIAQVTREAAHLAPFTDHPVHADALPFLRALRERLDIDAELLTRRRAALAEARHSPDDAVHARPVLPMSANYFFHRLGGLLEELISQESYTYTGVFDAGRGGMSAMRNLPRTGAGFLRLVRAGADGRRAAGGARGRADPGRQRARLRRRRRLGPGPGHRAHPRDPGVPVRAAAAPQPDRLPAHRRRPVHDPLLHTKVSAVLSNSFAFGGHNVVLALTRP